MTNQKTVFFGVAHWKKKWLAVPLFFLPAEEAVEGNFLESVSQRETPGLDKINVFATILPWLWSDRDLKKLCAMNGIPLTWVTDRFQQTTTVQTGVVNRREKRKIQSLTTSQFQAIRKELLKLNTQVALIVRILWHLNQELKQGGGFVTLEELVRLQVQDISPNREEKGNWIRLLRRGASLRFMVISLPSHLWRALCRQINEDSVFVFVNKQGGPLHLEYVDAFLRKAGKVVGLRGAITSMSLRPVFNQEKAKKQGLCDVSVEKHWSPISSQEWSAMVV